MINSILKLVVRNFLSNPAFSLVTTGGLIAALTSAILLFLWVEFEFTYNRNNPDNERVFALLINERIDGVIETSDETTASLEEFLSKDVSDIEAMTRFDGTQAMLAVGTRSIQKRGVYADSGYFKVFNPTIISGNVVNPLINKNSIVISKDLADELFPDGDAVGKFIQIDLKNEFKVTAVFSPFPVNSSLRSYHFVLPYNAKSQPEEWKNYNLKLRKGSSPYNAKLLIDEKLKEVYGNTNSTSLLFAMTDWRLHWNFENGKSKGGKIVYVITFALAGFFILTMGCMNHVNITTARALKRAREIGVRKVSGATRFVLAKQFMTETFTIVFIAGIISTLVAWLALPLFNELTNTQLTLKIFSTNFIVAFSGIIFITSLLSGIYPALILSSLKPARILKNDCRDSIQGSTIRKSLVVVQLSLCIIILFAAFVLRKQTQYMQKLDLGFDKNNVINVWLDRSQQLPLDQLQNEIENHSSIVAAGISGASPMEINGSAEVTLPQKPSLKPILMNGVSVHYDMIPTLGIKIIEGRNFSREFNESNSFIITQQAAKVLGLENPVGQSIQFNMFGNQTGTIVGVIENFQNEDIHLPVDPVILTFGPDEYLFNLFIRFREGHTDAAIAHIKSVFEKYQPGIPVDYSFLDGDFQNQFYQEKLLNNLSTWSTVIAIIISSLGLYGLTMFNTEKRTKEIGIRKVLGASSSQIVQLVLRDLLKPTTLSLIISFPIAYIIMDSFLSDYVYRTQIHTADFLLVASTIIILLLITTLRICLKAAAKNPVDAVKAN